MKEDIPDFTIDEIVNPGKRLEINTSLLEDEPIKIYYRHTSKLP